MSSPPQTVAVVLAGGRGKRVGADRNKVLVEISGRTIIEWSIRAFATHPQIDRVVVVAHTDDVHQLRAICAKYDIGDLIEGGAERPDSERNALDYLRADIDSSRVSTVLIHDGARPCVCDELITRTVQVAGREGVVPTLPAPPLLVDDGQRITAAPTNLRRAQTPQGGPAGWLLAAYDAALTANFAGTDTASYLEHAQYAVRAIDGDEANLKVTYPEDVATAAATLGR